MIQPKRLLTVFLIILVAIQVSACKTTTVVKVPKKVIHVPPGQAKKMTGSKSAKPFAPGQQKKKK